jgi:hypothetical protein
MDDVIQLKPKECQNITDITNRISKKETVGYITI